MDFKGKIGPLPAWVWGLILGALIVAWMWVRRRNQTAASNTAAAQTDAVQETSPNSQLLAGINTSGIPLSSLTGATTVPDAPNQTNASWLAQGIMKGSDLGYTPLDTETALRNYLNGTSLTPTQTQIVNSILSALGTPPQGINGTPSQTTTQPSVEGLFRRKGTQAIYEALSDGTLHWLDQGEWAALGRPAFTDIPATDPLWNRPLTGPEAPDNVKYK